MPPNIRLRDALHDLFCRACIDARVELDIDVDQLVLRNVLGEVPVVRFIPGPELALLTAASRETLFRDSFGIAHESDRMGYRLTGPPLALSAHREMLSSGVTAGTIQLPPGGSPIVLMADRQTTGGYPRLGEVIAVDLPRVAQLRPSDTVRFVPVSLDLAHTLYRERERQLTGAKRAMHLRFAPGADGSR